MKIISFLYFLLLKLRYKFIISGFEKIDKNKKYIIFPNHQALVDPQIVASLIGQKINISPVVSETYFNLPVIKYIFKMVGAVAMGDIQRGTGSIDDVKNAFKNIEIGINEGKNILLYPAGQLYSQGYEVIKGKKSAYNLVQILPADVEILVIKTTGLWGSIWSKAWIGTTPNLITTFLKACVIIVGNIFFLIPKREVKIEIVNYTKTLKNIKNLNDFNQTLEDFYNKDGKEEVKYLQHYFYKNNVIKKEIPKIDGSVENMNIQKIDEKTLNHEVFNKIIEKISNTKEISKENISTQSLLINDLFFDSLDTAELKSYVQTFFSTADNPPISTLKSVGDLYLMALGQSKSKETLKPCDWILDDISEKTIYEILKNGSEKHKEHTTILSLFKESFQKNKKSSFVYDTIFGVQSKKDFLIKAYLIAGYIKKIDGKYIGIMLPSVSSASLIILSTYLAGKIPVMLNWTVGETALSHCIKFAQIDTILTSKNFYEKIQNEGTNKFNNKYLFLEDMLKNIPTFTKIKALIKSIIFSIPKISSDDEAVLLFTSGSESLPKAVSLTHKNIISDIMGALYHFPLTNHDILIGFLPPFHSFGFTINTIMPLISGLKVAYTPDPNDAKTIQTLVQHCKITALTATPTFLDMILKASNKENLQTLKYGVVGAEKCRENTFELFETLCPTGKILEGYGITECSPVISINPPSKPKRGSVGIPILGSEVIICSLENQSILENNKEGMIYFSGENVFSGYLDTSLEAPFDTINGKQYYKTGDLGYLDTDGYLFITGRLKRFIKIAGEMISLPFIEGVLQKKYGNDLAIEALEKDGNVKIVLFALQNYDVAEIGTYLRENGVSNLVKISEIQTLSALPVLGTGKIDYKVLKNMIQFENKTNTYNFENIKETIIKKISELSNLDISTINENSIFGEEIHLDSIDVGELSIFIKTHYNHIEYKDLKDIKTIGDLLTLIKIK